MTWNSIWEQIFKNKEWGKYPPEELIRFIAKNYYSLKNRSKIKILDIGCGTGACSWYLSREGFSAFGIDGSKTAIKKAKQRFEKENLKGEFTVSSIPPLPWPNEYFDCVIDVGCLTCNSKKDAKLIIKDIYRVLKPGGKHFSITLKKGRRNKQPLLAHLDPLRFTTKQDLKELYSQFENLEIEYSIRTMNNRKYKIGQWVLNCQK